MSNYKKLSKLGSGAFATTFLVEAGGGADADARPSRASERYSGLDIERRSQPAPPWARA